MTQETINAIKSRCEAATSGPWIGTFERDNRKGIRIVVKVGITEVAREVSIENTKFIINARADILALIAEIERLTGKRVSEPKENEK